MACTLQLYVKNTKGGEVTDESIVLKQDVGENEKVTMHDIADLIMHLPENQKQDLVRLIQAAKSRVMTDKELTKQLQNGNYQFVSNTSVGQLLNKYPSLQSKYKDMDILMDDDYTLLHVNRFSINGTSYYGRVIRPNGEVMFIIKDLLGADKFLQYLVLKKKINDALAANGNEFTKEYAEFNSLKPIAEKHKKTIKNLLIEFLHDRKSITDPSEVLAVRKFIDNILGIVRKTTDLEQKLRLISKVKGKVWTVSLSELYKYLKDNYDLDDLKKDYSVEQLQEILSQAFGEDENMYRVRVMSIKTENVSEGSQEAGIPLTERQLRKVWDTIRNSEGANKYKEEKDNEWGKLFKKSYGKAVEANVNMVYTVLELYLPELGLIDGMRINPKLEIQAEGTVIGGTYTKVKEPKSKTTIELTFPWTSLGSALDYSYDAQAIPEPVVRTDENNMDANGKYKGYYIYSMMKDGKPVYAASKYVVSPNQTAHIFNSLEKALSYLDRIRTSKSLYSESLLKLKTNLTKPYVINLEASDVVEGQIVTTLAPNEPLSSKRMTADYIKLADKSIEDFYNHFEKLVGEDIRKLITPELAYLFLKMVDNILPKLELSEAEQLVKDQLPKIIDEILAMPVENYLITDIIKTDKETYYYVKKLPATNVIDNIGPAVKTVTIGQLVLAKEFFENKYNLSIEILSEAELAESKFKDIKNFKAATEGNTVYISSKADIYDLYHELSHLFLGAMRVQSTEGYISLIQNIKKKKQAKFNKTIDNLRNSNVYKDMAKEDLEEETCVRIIEKKLRRDGRLSSIIINSDFQMGEFNDIAKGILEDLEVLKEQLGEEENGLAFGRGLEDTNKLNRNRKISNIIKAKIGDGTITRSGDC